MANVLDQAKGKFSAFQGTVNETHLSVKKETGAKAGKLHGQVKDQISTAPQVLGTAATDLKDNAEASASSVAGAAKREMIKYAVKAFFARIFEKCCDPFNKKKD